MSQPVQRDRLIWVGLGLTFALVILALGLAALRLAVSLAKPLPVYGTVADFNLTNQLGKAVSLGDLRGHTWVGDIIFTRCAGPCLKMSRQMKDLQGAVSAKSGVRFISLTTDPDYDTPPVLQRYAERFGADPKRWLFLTGTKQQIGMLATNSLKLVALPKGPETQQNSVDLFIHSTTFVLVDKSGHLRGVFETSGEDVDANAARKEILSAIRRLEREK